MEVAIKLIKLVVMAVIFCVVSVLMSMMVLQLLFDFLDVRVNTETIAWVGGCVGITATVLFCFALVWLFHLQDKDLVDALAPLRNLQRQIDRLDLKIPDGLQSIDTLKKLSSEIDASVQAMDRLKVLVDAINQQYATLSASEIEAVRKTISSQLKGCALEFTHKGFTVVWNSLPYHQYFDKMDDEDKVAYFNAIHTGNWQPLRRRSKDKWRD